ncbi:zinc finger protein 572-like [Melanotaenia boesemani]|uniref:zinc finger protein 572-like n=1 Tax=Melanotaenia boesemani TaxID=1250792 RepID=UPI001C05971A|nr:zinc finger protein 572-like [Melanotaenia boesemani]
MSSVQHLREFISERLTAAAEEIFTEFEKTIVQYEEEIDRQRRLLETSKAQRSSHTADFPHQHVYEEAFPDVQQLYNQRCNSDLDQEEPELLHIKDEKEELLTIQEGEQLLLKHENDGVSTTATQASDELGEADLNKDQIPSHSSHVDQSLEGSRLDDSGAKRDAELTPNTSYEAPENNSAENVFLLENHSNTDNEAEKLYLSFACGKKFFNLASIETHTPVHTSEKPYSCKTCGKCFSKCSSLLCHMKTHSGNRLYSCKTCGRSFSGSSHLVRHMRTHTGEKPYSCKTCGKGFNGSSHLVRHMRTHTGEKPYSCKTCGKRFSQNSNVMRHMRTHR